MTGYEEIVAEKEELSYYYNVALKIAPSDVCQLTSFSLAGVPGVIDEENKTVSVTLPAGTDVSALIPDKMEVSYKAAHNADEAQDYSQDVAVTVTAEDGVHTATYIVKVTVQTNAPSDNPATGVSTAAGAAVIGLVALSVLFAARKRRG